MSRFRRLIALAVAISMSGHPGMVAAQDDVRSVDVRFDSGTSGTSISDSLRGRATVLYKLAAEAGQTMNISLNSDNLATYFNVYEPGFGLGDAALAVSEMTGPMVPDLNRFSGELPTSGIYTIAVYLYRSAARRDEVANYTLDVSITGSGGAVVKNDYADGMQGGPDFLAVATSGGTLIMRSGPSTGASEVTRLSNGTVVRNLGCRASEGRIWCNIATQADPGYEGWAAQDFLREGNAPDGGYVTQLPETPPQSSGDAMVPGTGFHATGKINCYISPGAEADACDFGVYRIGNGTADVTITWPDGYQRMIRFENGQAVSNDKTGTAEDPGMSSTRNGDMVSVYVGDELFEIPDAVLFGG